MEPNLKKWLTADELPADFYQLVEKPRLCSDREVLQSAFSAAYEFYHRYEAHRKQKMQQRAVQLMRFVSNANVTVSDDAFWAEYDDRVAARLRAEYERNVSGGIRHARSADLCRWLTSVKNVVPDRADKLAHAWVKSVPETDPSSQVASTEDESKDAPAEEVVLTVPVTGKRPQKQPLPSEPRPDQPLPKPTPARSHIDDWIPLQDADDESTEPEEAVPPEKTAATQPDDNHREPVPSPSRQAVSPPPSKTVASGKVSPSRVAPPSPPLPPRRANPVRPPKAKRPKPPRNATRQAVVDPNFNEAVSDEPGENAASWTVLIIFATTLVVAMIGTVAVLMLEAFDSSAPSTIETPTAEMPPENRPAEEVSDEEVSDEEMSDEEVSDEEKSGEEVSDEEMSDEEKSGEEVSDEEMSDEEKSGEEKSGEEKSGEEKSDEEKSKEKTSDEETSSVPFRNRDDSQSVVDALTEKCA